VKINISEKFEGINDFLQEKMKEWSVPGMTVAVIKDEEIIALS
jgi:hypothetical protein